MKIVKTATTKREATTKGEEEICCRGRCYREGKRHHEQENTFWKRRQIEGRVGY